MKSLLLLLTIVMLITSCSYRRSVPDETGRPPAESKQEEIRDKNEQGHQKDNLYKSDKDAVEENINAFELENDLKETSFAESQKISLSNIGVNQFEVSRINSTIDEAGTIEVIQTYDTRLPAEIRYGVKYDKYDLAYDYFLITSEQEVSIHRRPDPDTEEVCKAYNGEKLALHQKVSGAALNGSDIWYKVSCKHDGSIVTGYIHSESGETRTFQFNKMLASIKTLLDQLSNEELYHVSNYKNVNGAPPEKVKGAATDEYGMRIYQSAPGYYEPDTSSDFRYVPDGMLLKLIGETGDFYRAFVISFDRELFIPKKYIDKENPLTQLKHVAVVDRSQQNQAVFEISGGGITMVSYTLATTGLKGETSFETPLGYFRAIEKKERFEYLKDNSDEIAGYAPFALRFCGGAYIHGVPVAYEEKDGERIDPGIQEYLHTIGTFPRSHMCVRNFSSHAEFLYNWFDTENGAVIIIE
ncbi:MAG TPA: L,D-transpeptidase [Candidatus Atribacteria bacterium]|nr:L,D-transpeptidase [Candidatus Atribacteria bacterium]HPT79159.1 L,D-transpeptidase [Candidatus Atribacteria bacterium]